MYAIHDLKVPAKLLTTVSTLQYLKIIKLELSSTKVNLRHLEKLFTATTIEKNQLEACKINL
jgi:hypothetical protein